MNENDTLYIDDDIGITNRVEEQNMDAIVQDTFNDIATVLADHCGPYSQFAMLTSVGIGMLEPTFTKDGIGIVNAMRYKSKLQEFVRTTMAYMGRHVETSAGDGTTSSMILLAKGIVGLRDRLKKLKRRYTYTQLVRAYNDFVTAIEKFMEEHAHKDDIDVWTAVYSQAWTSSHGNYKLAKTIADLYADNPKEAWNYLTIDKALYESDDEYSTVIDESQYSSDEIRIWPEKALTSKSGTARVATNECTIIANCAPGDGSDEGDQLMERITNIFSANDGTKYTIICPRNIPTLAQNAIITLFRDNPNVDLAFVLVNVDAKTKVNDLSCIRALSHITTELDERVLTYEYANGKFVISDGLYANPEKSVLNPCWRNPEYKELNELVEEIDAVINAVRNDPTAANKAETIRRLNKARLKLTISRRSYFLIGGTAYDSKYSMDVVIDCMLAAKRGLDHGFVLGGNKTLFRVLDCYEPHEWEYSDEGSTELGKIFRDVFMNAIANLHKAMLSNFYGKTISKIVANYFVVSTDIMKFSAYDSVSKNTEAVGRSLNSITESDRGQTVNNPLILQPIGTDVEFLRRFGELALKFINTKRMIVEGGMCRNQKETIDA